MPKVKIPRKSTIVDMTAMCDVAFLLLSFFILATKQKPPEVMAVTPPNSISAKVAPDKAILITMTKDGRAFISLGDETRKADILKDINTIKQLGLTPSELAKWGKTEFYGLPLNQVKSSLALSDPIPPIKLPGIPISDTTNNELTDWLRSVTNVFAGEDQKQLQEMLLIKGDGEVLYPVFKNVKRAFKKNQLFKFRIVTNGEPVPIGSELYMDSKKK
ncbi:MAG TPA: biopolymer transporter ExbD [Ferruginibacter sp.]|nr:biopolymer transporter ExbD [Ferruginibacter sp.]HRE64441.1 biopolymer transporter ExbD [Ferruginibacter sp.]